MYSEASQCRICGNADLLSVLDLGTQALTGVFPSRTDQHIATGPLELVKCNDTAGQNACGLVQLRHSYASGLIYGDNYGYRSGLNQSMIDHLSQKAALIKQTMPLRSGDLVLDIGSNDGTLLRALSEPGVDLVGMDPSGAKFKQFYPAGAVLIPEVFSAAKLKSEFPNRRARVVTSIAMFYDLESPLAFMQEVNEVLADDGLWVFEQSYLPHMLQMNSYDTVCHEHLEYYAMKQILWMCQRTGFKVVNVELNNVNGGSFSVTVAKAESGHVENQAALRQILDFEAGCRLNSLDVYRSFAERAFAHRDELIRCLEQLAAQSQRVLGYGASTKGNVILQFCGVTQAMLPAIAEVNPDKFGCFTPQTLIPIISEADARAQKPDVFLVLPWHFRQNIIGRERSFLQAGGKLLFPLPAIELIDHAKSLSDRT